MKTKSSLIFAVIIFTQFCVAFGQYFQNFQAVYPVNDWNISTTNYTLARGNGEAGYLLATNPKITPVETDLLAIKLDAYFNIQYFRSFKAIYDETIVKIETKDAIRNLKKEYVICGNITYSNTLMAFIAKFDENFVPIWGQIYPNINNLNSIVEIMPLTSDKYCYVAVGSYIPINSPMVKENGVILCIDQDGNPAWQNNTEGPNESDLFKYNQVIPVYSPESTTPDFAVVGNIISATGNNKDVVVTKVDINGNNLFSRVYGAINTMKYIYDEEAFGICASEVKKELLMCGRTKCYNNLVTKWDDVLVFSIDVDNGDLIWHNRYDLPLNAGKGEFAQNIISVKDKIYVNGYYPSTVFNPNISNDAFLLELYYDGIPSNRIKIFGDKGDDRIYRLMENDKEDGITNAGYTSSYNPYIVTKLTYVPYIIESYQNVQNRCHDKYYEIQNVDVDLADYKIKHLLVDTETRPFGFERTDLGVQELIICKKEAFDDQKLSTTDNNTVNKISVNPTIANSFVNIVGVNGEFTYNIYNQTGIIIKTGTLSGDSQINISNFKSGIYNISILNNNKLYNFKFIKE